MALNTYFQQLSNEITLFGIIIVLEIAIFGIWAVIYLRRQAKALQRTADIEEQRNSLLIRSRRDRLAGEIGIDDPLEWLNHQLGRRVEYPLKLFEVIFKVGRTCMVVGIAENGKSVAVSTKRPKELEKVFKRVGLNGHSMEASDLDAAASIVKGAKAYRAALVDRDTGDVFDLEIKAAGEKLGVDWSESDEIWFYVGASKGSKE